MYQQPLGWSPQPWSPPPKPSGPRGSHVVLGCVVVSALMCVAGAILGALQDQPTHGPVAAPDAAAPNSTPPVVAPMAPASPSGVEPPPEASRDNRMVIGAYRASASVEQARTTMVAWAVLADPSIQRSAATGPRHENATYVSLDCGRQWLARLSARPMPFADAQGTIGENLRDAGFEQMQCVRSAEEGARLWSLPLRR